MDNDKMILGKKLDKALNYVSKNLLLSSNNSKPVLFHSFKVSYLLYELNYSENIVIASALHDLIEDTDITYDDIKLEYGKEIADIVDAVSFDKNIEDKLIQAKLMFEKAKNYGKDALIVKCSDLIDNIDYIKFVDDINDKNNLIEKYRIFLEMSKELIGSEKVYQLLEEKYNNYFNF